jgi:hypothetical protein
MTDEPTLPSGEASPKRGRRTAHPATGADTAAPAVEAPAPAIEALDSPPLPEVPITPSAAPSMLDAVEVMRGAVGGIRAGDVYVRNGVVGGIAGRDASVEMGLVGGIAAREASVSQGVVRAVLAQDVRIEQSVVRSVVANRVQVGPTTAIGFVIARRIDGNPRVLLDWRGALALAAVFGALAGILRLSRRRA